MNVAGVLVVKSASGKKGKVVKPRSIPRGGGSAGAVATKKKYLGLSYKLKFGLLHPALTDDGAGWEKSSSWQVAADERDSPPLLMFSKVGGEYYELTLVDVLWKQCTEFLREMSEVASFDSLARHGDEVKSGYAKLSEAQRIELWVRASAAGPIGLAVPVSDLLDLAFQEWSAEIEDDADEVLSEPRPADAKEFLEKTARRMNGSLYLRGTPLQRSVQRFVHRWFTDL